MRHTLRIWPLVIWICSTALTWRGDRSVAAPIQSPNPEEIRSNAIVLLADYAIHPPILIPTPTNGEERGVLGAILEGVVSKLTRSPCLVSWSPNTELGEYLSVSVLDDFPKPQLNAALRPLFEGTNAFRASRAWVVDGKMLDPFWAIRHESDLTSGKQSSLTLLTAEDMHTERIDPRWVWSLVLKAVLKLKGIEIDSDSAVGSNLVFFAATHWKPLPPQGGTANSSVACQRFHIKMEVHQPKSCAISVESLVKTRKRESGREYIFRGDRSFLRLRSDAFPTDVDDPESSNAVLRAIIDKLTAPPDLVPKHETK